jgi:hypothetical protein
MQVSPVTMSSTSLRIFALPPCLPMGVKRLTAGGLDAFWIKGGFWMQGGFWMGKVWMGVFG